MLETVLLAIGLSLAAAVVFGFAGGFIVMVTWGSVAPVFGLPTLSFWEAYSLAVLVTVLGGALRGPANTK